MTVVISTAASPPIARIIQGISWASDPARGPWGRATISHVLVPTGTGYRSPPAGRFFSVLSTRADGSGRSDTYSAMSKERHGDVGADLTGLAGEIADSCQTTVPGPAAWPRAKASRTRGPSRTRPEIIPLLARA